VLIIDERDEGGNGSRFSYVDGATSRQADCSSDNDENNDEFSDENEVGYSSKHNHFRDGQTIRISKYRNMRENAGIPH